MNTIEKIGLIWSALVCVLCCAYAFINPSAWMLAGFGGATIVLGVAAYVADKKGGDNNGEEDN